MTKIELENILLTNNFKSTVQERNEEFNFTFTKRYIKRNGEILGEYDLIEDGGDFFMEFSEVENSIDKTDFKNVLLVSDSNIIVLNFDQDLLKRNKGYRIVLKKEDKVS